MLKYHSSNIIEETTSLTNNPIIVYQSTNNKIFLQRVDWYKEWSGVVMLIINNLLLIWYSAKLNHVVLWRLSLFFLSNC